MVHRGSFALFNPFPHRQFQLDVDEAILERCYYLKVWPLLNILTLIVLKHLIMMRVRKSLEAS